MPDIDRIIHWYQQGVTFVCGCRAGALHSTALHALRAGLLPVDALCRCPLHGARLVEPARVG